MRSSCSITSPLTSTKRNQNVHQITKQNCSNGNRLSCSRWHNEYSRVVLLSIVTTNQEHKNHTNCFVHIFRPEVQSIFDKYTKSAINRRLKKEDALQMFEKEFHLSPQRAEEMFYHFDTDRNGYMSLWEFVHFYKVIGQS